MYLEVWLKEGSHCGFGWFVCLFVCEAADNMPLHIELHYQ